MFFVCHLVLRDLSYTEVKMGKSIWANLTESRLVEENCDIFISLIIFPFALEAFAYAKAQLKGISLYISNVLLCSLVFIFAYFNFTLRPNQVAHF